MTIPGAILFGRYRIDEQLRQGGMGTIFKAKDLHLNQIVAVKEAKFTDKKLRKQFELEAQLLAFLRHPSLPIVGDHFGIDDELFLVMDYIDGYDLGEVLRAQGEPFPVDSVLQWADQLLDALIYIHGQNPPIIHRDIKPENLKLSSKGKIMLLDFGLAKGLPTAEIKVTTSGSIFGYTPMYAPLEQRQGTGTDARSDLYSLGATLYHLLLAKTPPDSFARAAAVINGDPDPLLAMHIENPQVPLAVSDLIHQAMSLKRELRPQSALEMRRLLDAATHAVNDPPPVPVPDLTDTFPSEAPRQELDISAPLREESVVTVTPQKLEPATANQPSGFVVDDGIKSTPSKLDHGFYAGLVIGVGSSTILIVSTLLRLGLFGVALWLLSLFLTGALIGLLYSVRAPGQLKDADALAIGGVGGLVSAIVQWLLLIVAYFINSGYFANKLIGPFGSDDALLLLVCLLGLLGCFSPIGAFIAVRYHGRARDEASKRLR